MSACSWRKRNAEGVKAGGIVLGVGFNDKRSEHRDTGAKMSSKRQEHIGQELVFGRGTQLANQLQPFRMFLLADVRWCPLEIYI